MADPTTNLVTTWWPVVSGSAVGSVALWRYVVRPRVVKRTQEFRAFRVRCLTALDQIETVHTALGPNGGKSLADRINYTSEAVAIMDRRVSWLIDQDNRPMLEMSPDGANLRINTRFTDAFGYGPGEMLGLAWIRLLHGDDRDAFMRDWNYAIGDARLFERQVRVVTRARAVLTVRVTFEPSFHERSRELLRWFGRIESVSTGGAA